MLGAIAALTGAALVHCTWAAEVSGNAVTSLNGQWHLTNDVGNVSISATVPGQAHTDLLKAAVIGEPYFGYGDAAYNWVALHNWTYTRDFTVDAPAGARVVLVADGLNTIADVSVNGHHAMHADNMYRQWSADVGGFLVPGGPNTISVRFTSSVLAAAAQYARHAATPAEEATGGDYWPQWGVPPQCPPPQYHGFCYFNMLRTEPCSAGWDWGPAYAPVGIYRDLSLMVYPPAAPTASLANVTAVMTAPVELESAWYASAVRQGPPGRHGGVVVTAAPASPTDATWTLALTAHVTSSATGTFNVSLTLAFPPTMGRDALQVQVLATLEGGATTPVGLSLPITDAPLWWPAGYGSPTLMTATVEVGTPSASSVLASKTLSVGARVVQLVQEPLLGGKSFYFAVNGVPIWVKGANWIPADAFEARITPEYLTDLFAAYKAAHFNTLRNWGGGIWQRDQFYDMADAAGLLVWEENMFACALYPNTTAFLDNVAGEVGHQVRRLAHHPSIMLWAGSNENEIALVDNWYGVPVDHKDVYADMYSDLYWGTVRPATEAVDSTRPYLASSPSNGDETASAPLAANPGSPLYGDVHFYDYTGNCWDDSIYPKARFASEFGYQSWPGYTTLSSAVPAGAAAWDSEWMAWRQHHPAGRAQITAFLDRHFAPVNASAAAPTGHFASQLWMTQLYQALCMKHETEHYRRLRDSVTAAGGGTMGTLYWQANDIWQGASWSSIEYGGRWKMLHSFARRFYAPWQVQAAWDHATDIVTVWGLNDAPTSQAAGRVAVEAWGWNGTLLGSLQVQATVPPATAAPLKAWNMTALLAATACPDPGACVLTLTSVAKVGGQELTSTNFLLLGQDLKHMGGFGDPQLTLATELQASGTVAVTVSKGGPLGVFVWLESPCAGWFSDNGFIMTQDHTVVTWTPQSGYGPTPGCTSQQPTFTVTSLWDRYAHN